MSHDQGKEETALSYLEKTEDFTSLRPVHFASARSRLVGALERQDL